MRELITLEKAVLAYASYGYIRDKKNRYPYFLKNYNCIHIRENLIKFGLLELGTYFQSIPYYPYKKLQMLLKQKKCPCGNSKINVIKYAKEYLNERDLEEYFGYRCYYPSHLSSGKYETNIDYFFVDMQLDKLQCIDLNCYNYYLQRDNLKEIHVKSTDAENSYIITESKDVLSLQGYNECQKLSYIKLFCDDIYIKDLHNIDEILFYKEEKQILFVKKIEKQKYLCKRFDIKSRRFLSELQFEDSPWNYLHAHTLESLNTFDKCEIIKSDKEEENKYQQLVGKMLKEQKGIFDTDGSIIYYFSVSNSISQIVVEKYLNEFVEISSMPPLFEGDFTKKYKMKISPLNKEIEYLVLWLFKDKQIIPPQVNEIPISCFCNKTKLVSAKKIYKYYDYVINKLSLDRECVINNLLEFNKLFPIKILIDDEFYKSYRSVSRYARGKDFVYIYEHSQEYEKRYKQIYIYLVEKKLIPIKWKSEFELYMLIKSFFSDTIFQYRDEWLGTQSLDIFIPQISTGIEYQGIQHYEAVEVFGGKESFDITQKRDKNKKEKCQKEGVKLLHWDYRLKISVENLEKVFDSINIKLPVKNN